MLPGSGDSLGADKCDQKPYFRFNEPEVVLHEQILVPGSIDEASREIRRPYRPKYGKNGRPGALAAKLEVEIWRRPIFRLSDSDFLFDFQYIMGSISHRYGAVRRRCYHYAIVTASALGESIPSPKGVR